MASDAECKVWDVDRRVIANTNDLAKRSISISREFKWYKDRVMAMLSDYDLKRRFPVWVYADRFEFDGKKYSTAEAVREAIFGPVKFMYFHNEHRLSS